jgi:tetratricopeptide (TPR) repeat protein
VGEHADSVALRRAVEAHGSGTQALAEERFSDAKLAFELAGSLYRSLDRSEDEATELFYAGMADELAGEVMSAFRSYEAALQIYQSLDLAQEEAAAHRRIGDLARAVGQIDEAITAYAAARAAFERSGASAEARTAAELIQEIDIEVEESARTLFVLDEGNDPTLFETLGSRIGNMPWDVISWTSPRSTDLRARRGDAALYFLQPIKGIRGLDQIEFIKRLERQGVSVILLMREGIEVPPEFLTTFEHVSYASPEDVQTVLNSLENVPVVNFRRLSPHAFESLIYELLVAEGFLVQRQGAGEERGVDFVVTVERNDPLGAEYSEQWLVQAKHAHGARGDLRALRNLAAITEALHAQNALYVTSGQITSVTADWIASLSHPRLRAIDGTGVRNAVMRHPALARRYFSPPEQRE